MTAALNPPPVPAPKTKGKGCLIGCLIAAGIAALVAIAAMLAFRYLYARRHQVLEWAGERLTSGVIEIESPEGFQPLPAPQALLPFPGVRASIFVGAGSPVAARTHYMEALERDGWTPATEPRFSLEAVTKAIGKTETGTIVTMDIFEREPELLLLQVAGSPDNVLVSLVSAPRDSPLFQGVR